VTAEQRARQNIDRQLEQAGWLVQDYRQMNILAGPGVAVREFPLKTGQADYMLYGNGMAIGVVEAKPEGHTLAGAETQSAKYTSGLPDGLPHHALPLPFAYETTGVVTQFTSNLDPSPANDTSAAIFFRSDRLSLISVQPGIATRSHATPNIHQGTMIVAI
jgi:type I restriction enzyme, R subunit